MTPPIASAQRRQERSVGLAWQQVEVRFVRGGGGIWHPTTPRLDRAWFKRHLIDYDFWYISHGKGYLRPPGKPTITLQPGMCLWMNPGSEFDVWCNPGSHFGTRYFHFELYDAEGRAIAPAELADIPLFCEMTELGYFDALTRRLLDLVAMQPFISDAQSLSEARQLAGGLLRTLLMEFVLASRIRQAHLMGGVAQDQLQLASGTISRFRADPGRANLGQMIEQSGYSDDHFRRIFKRVTGQTPHQALIAARIERARFLLLQSRLSINAIATELGYSNVQHFSMQFKQVTGIPPLTYRLRGPQ